MNLNANERISSVPDVAIERSRFVKRYKHTTTFNAGKLVPFYLEDCLPGTTYNLDTSFYCRMLTPIAPVMDDAYLDIFYFFVPYRLLWDHWREFYGENTSGYWAQQVQYNIPHIKTRSLSGQQFQPGSVADHFGFPVGTNDLTVSQFPFRAYALIWNEFFRNENTDNPTYLSTGDTDIWANSSTLNAGPFYGGDLLDVCRMHDYFSDCLPTAQKLPSAVALPLTGNAPVITGAEHNALQFNFEPMHFLDKTLDSPSNGMLGFEAHFTPQSVPDYAVASKVAASDDTEFGIGLAPSNLYADLSAVTAATINQLREAFAVQRYAERLALGGSRYSEQLSTFYGLTTQDSRLQRPEFLGSQRFQINMSQVLQTSETATTPLGNTGGFSATGGRGAHVTYSTQEHGLIMGLCCIRHDRSYQQGVHREWSRRDLYDLFQPPFAHLGNQAVLNKEIFAGSSSTDNQVFGYQEAWAEYRYKPNDITGQMRSGVTGSLDIWHYGDNYAQLPTLSQEWMAEGSAEIARTLAVEDTDLSDQFLVQFSVPTDTVAPMPLYSVPGMIDHF